MASIPSDIEGILRTLAQIYAMQGARREVAVLAKSKAEVEQPDYENWNGGTYGYSLTLRLPSAHYAQIEGERDSIEQDLLKRMEPLLRGYQNESIHSVVITLEIERRKLAKKCSPMARESGGKFSSHGNEKDNV